MYICPMVKIGEKINKKASRKIILDEIVELVDERDFIQDKIDKL